VHSTTGIPDRFNPTRIAATLINHRGERADLHAAATADAAYRLGDLDTATQWQEVVRAIHALQSVGRGISTIIVPRRDRATRHIAAAIELRP
jgi:hypothetical protein